MKISPKTRNKLTIAKYFFLWILFVFAAVKIKQYVLGSLTPERKYILINPLLSFDEAHNTGAAFNVLQNHTLLLIITAVIFIAAITVLVIWKTPKLSQSAVSAMSLLTAGMTMNTFERIRFGYVIDYMTFAFADKFPLFNIADVMIIIGAFMLAAALIWNTGRRR